ncbi:charged multivesicular body protein 6-A-like [Saccoglossus kowalevskii]
MLSMIIHLFYLIFSYSRKAKLLLKKKRYQEQLLDKTDNQLDNLDRLVQDIEFSQVEMQVVEGLKVGNDCLKKMHQMMSIEDVERIMEETQEGIEYQREIDELLAGSLTDEDEDAILAELEAITQQTDDVQLPDVPADKLPHIEGKALKQNLSSIVHILVATEKVVNSCF